MENVTQSQQAAIDKFWAAQEKDEFECVDNERIARKGNAEEEAKYKRLQSEGCCGDHDVELQCDDGTVLLYGFNYGH